MIYSCFNQLLGEYEYFEDDRGHATNGDLAVPSFPRRAGKVGVPSIEAGRTLPKGARRTGRGFRARGLLVQCKPSEPRALSGLGADGAISTTQWWVIGLGLVAVTMYGLSGYSQPQHRRRY